MCATWKLFWKTRVFLFCTFRTFVLITFICVHLHRKVIRSQIMMFSLDETDRSEKNGDLRASRTRVWALKWRPIAPHFTSFGTCLTQSSERVGWSVLSSDVDTFLCKWTKVIKVAERAEVKKVDPRMFRACDKLFFTTRTGTEQKLSGRDRLCRAGDGAQKSSDRNMFEHVRAHVCTRETRHARACFPASSDPPIHPISRVLPGFEQVWSVLFTFSFSLQSALHNRKIKKYKKWTNWKNWIFLKKWKKGASQKFADQKGKMVQIKVHQSVHLGKMKNWKIELESNRGLSKLKFGCSGVFQTRLTRSWFTSVLRNPRVLRHAHPNLGVRIFRGRMFAPVWHATPVSRDRHMSSCGITCICGFLTLEFGKQARIWTYSKRGNEKICAHLQKLDEPNIFEKSWRKWKKLMFSKNTKNTLLWFFENSDHDFENVRARYFLRGCEKSFRACEIPTFSLLSLSFNPEETGGNGLTFLCKWTNMNVHACARVAWHVCQKRACLREESRANQHDLHIKTYRSNQKLFFHFYQLFSFATWESYRQYHGKWTKLSKQTKVAKVGSCVFHHVRAKKCARACKKFCAKQHFYVLSVSFKPNSSIHHVDTFLCKWQEMNGSDESERCDQVKQKYAHLMTRITSREKKRCAQLFSKTITFVHFCHFCSKLSKPIKPLTFCINTVKTRPNRKNIGK